MSAPLMLHGIHHVTAVTADARANHHFYTSALGMRLVKKTVNQDDVSVYHLFYADGEGRPGTDLTFFEFPTLPERRGTQAVTRTMLRVRDAQSLDYWQKRFADHHVKQEAIREIDGRASLLFEDHEGQRLALIADPASLPGAPWAGTDIPAAHQILGLGPVEISVVDLGPTERFVTSLYGMTLSRRYQRSDGATIAVFEMGNGGADKELHIAVEPHLRRTGPGAGGVHHIAFRARDDEYAAWVARYEALGLRSSGPVDRFWFRSLYVREPNHVLFEIATDGPGFDADEPKETMGQSLSLPPFLAHRRAEIEAGLAPL